MELNVGKIYIAKYKASEALTVRITKVTEKMVMFEVKQGNGEWAESKRLSHKTFNQKYEEFIEEIAMKEEGLEPVLIIEQWVSPEEMRENLATYNQILGKIKARESVESAEVMQGAVERLEIKLAKNPDGYWRGFKGFEYKPDTEWFVKVAKDTVMDMKKMFKDCKFRVVHALKPIDSPQWVGYTYAYELPELTQKLYSAYMQGGI